MAGRVPVVMTKTLRDFTDRQAEFIEHVASGRDYNEIAREMGLSHRYVQTQAYRLAKRIPGAAPPRMKLAIFWHRLDAKGARG